MLIPIDEQSAAAFYRYGERTFLEAGGQWYHPEHISIGEDVWIRSHYWLSVIENNLGQGPKLVVGDGCRSEKGLYVCAMNRIELERHVIIGPDVYISDMNHEYRHIGKPVIAQGLIDRRAEVFIGEGTRIGEKAVIVGNVRIGKGCIIRPHSVIEQDVPDRCVVGGSPQRIEKVYEPSLNKWKDVGSGMYSH